MKKVLTISTVCLIFLLFIFPSAARADGVTMEAEVGFNGSYLLGHWAPIRVQLKNSGSDLEGSLEVRVKTGQEGSIIYSTPVSLPNTSEKEYIIYARMYDVERSLNINLSDGKGNILQSLKVQNLNPIGYDLYFMGLVTDDQPSLNYWQEKLAGDKYLSNYETVFLDASNFPERRETLSAFSVLIFNNIDTSSFRPKQLDALEAWLEDGGLLIIGSGVNGKRTLSGLSGRLISASTAEMRSWNSLDVFEEIAGAPILGTTALQVLDISTEEAGIAAGDEQGSLVWIFQKGKGSIYLAGFDLGTEPIISWRESKLFWDNLITQSLSPDSLNVLRNPYNKISVSEGFSGALANIEAMEMPSAMMILFLFLFYLALAGPFNYLFLKKIDKREWSWFTIPALSILFAALIFGIGYNTKGGKLIINTISSVKLDSNTSEADLTNHIGIFIPRRGNYEVELDRFALLSLNNSSSSGNKSQTAHARVVQGNPSKIMYENANIWTMETFQTDSHKIDIGSIQSNLYYEMGKIKGTVRNDTVYPLEHLVIYTSDAFVEIGKIASGESKDVELDVISTGYPQNNAYKIIEEVFQQPLITSANNKDIRKLMARRSILEQTIMSFEYGIKQPIAHPIPITSSEQSASLGIQTVAISYFAFFEGERETGIKVNGSVPDYAETDGIITGSMDLTVVKDHMVNIPPGMLVGKYEEEMSQGVDYGGDMFYIYDTKGYAVFSIDLSSYIHLQDLKVLIGINITNGEGTMQVFDLEKEDYLDIQGENISINTDNIGKYVDMDNMVYFKVAPSHDYMECCLPYIALEGREP